MPEIPVNPWLLAQASLRYFTVKVLGFKYPSHYEDWEKLIASDDRVLVLAPRGHGKSIFFSLAYVLWRVIQGKREILLVSYSEDQVRRLIREIRVMVESNEFLAPLRPSTKEVWGTDQLSFANGSFISGLGFGTSSRGRHPDDIIVDDPLKDMGGMTDEDQERAFFGVITGMAMERTKLLVVGTPVNFGDLLEKLESNPSYKVWKKPALDEKMNPLFPHLWTTAALLKRRQEMGSLNFAREYLLQRIDPATAPFKRQYETTYNQLPSRFFRVVTVCDPAYSEGQGDGTAIVTVGHTHAGHAYVMEAKWIRREDPGAVVGELVKTILALNPEAVGIEKRKGDAIYYSFQEARTRRRLYNFKYVELQSRGASKENRINMDGGLVARWEARSVLIHPAMEELKRQLYAYRFDDKSKEHDDLVDALAYCFHPDMVKPDMGRQNVPLSAEEASVEGKPRYRVGQGDPWKPKEVYEWAQGPQDHGARLARSMDRRISDVA